MKEDIEIWLEKKELEFAQKDTKNLKITPSKYLDNTYSTSCMNYFSVISRMCCRSRY
jgi:hypothetical protein